MNPDKLSVKGTESGHQKALFAWAALARIHGFAVAGDMDSYESRSPDAYLRWVEAHGGSRPVPELEWLHSIPNGGARDPVTAARMKAEGARAGVADVFLPVARHGMHGLYIEMKRPADGRASPQQNSFAAHCGSNGYVHVFCRTWREAAQVIQAYLT